MALDFDLACTARLKIYDDERDSRLMEALGMGSVTRVFGEATTTTERSGATLIEAGWQVPDA